VHTIGASFPSGHAAYSTAYVAMAVIAWRVVPGFAKRALLILGAILVSASIGMSRIYLRAHYWSDVAGGWGLGFGIFGLCATVALIVLYLRETAPART
jgi:undecaprenyl-diphosphatase